MAERAPNFTQPITDAIIRIIRHLPGRPTWMSVIVAVHSQLGLLYSRQALGRNQSIRAALEGRRKRRVSPHAASVLSRVASLREDRDRYRRLSEILIEKHVTWLYNARLRGLSESDLDQPLPPVNRT